MTEPRQINENISYIDFESKDAIYTHVEKYFDSDLIRNNALTGMFTQEDGRLILRFEKRENPLTDSEMKRKYNR
jgi:hypothetical protein